MVEKLINYQKADAELKEIEKSLSESVERKKAMSAKKYLDGVVDNVNKLDDRAAELISAFEQATKEQIQLKEQEDELANSIEETEDENAVAFLLKKADELIAKIKALGEKASKIEKEIQALYKEYQVIKNTTKAAQDQYAEFGKKYTELKEQVKGKKEEVEKTLAKLKAEVEPTLMERYLKKRHTDKMYPVVYEVRGNACGACNMELPAVEINRLKKGEVIECSNCGRMIYQK
ncbi:MAG: hypothetical protein IJV99_01590 [Clostridia bacterium]|nr:hypothetical protein [Clostridia bacterium]